MGIDTIDCNDSTFFLTTIGEDLSIVALRSAMVCDLAEKD
jgi:hypothetical protein